MKIGDTVIREVLSTATISESPNIYILMFTSNYIRSLTTAYNIPLC